jgi:hypothetical protein
VDGDKRSATVNIVEMVLIDTTLDPCLLWLESTSTFKVLHGRSNENEQKVKK